jgi:hypothetical protein
LSLETSAMHGRLTCLACAGNLASSQVGLATRKKSSSRPCSWKYLGDVGRRCSSVQV